MTKEEVLRLIDSDYEAIQDELMAILGDEANDIGDAADAEELLSNQRLPHEYTKRQFVAALKSAVTHVASSAACHIQVSDIEYVLQSLS